MMAAQNGDYSAQAKIAYLLVAGDIKSAQQLWERLSASEANTQSAHVIEEVLALSRDDKKGANMQLQLATQASVDAESDPWILVGRAAWAQANGNQALAAQERKVARSLLAENSIRDGFEISAMAYAQFWSLGIFTYWIQSGYSP